ncbi:LamG-like jellyroll fold domain-containing protein [Sphingomonas sp. dw_22]|uniref:LamG-like jellyroll fold domain-containing protein n=1 Tax=Sphingomonas sp. dw_22 TaxID=2721175 RepID=UPI001BD624C5|nr:LamG-like jellyroll fold domain-containing protein [Sphingomonas sp. dw_22]
MRQMLSAGLWLAMACPAFAQQPEEPGSSGLLFHVSGETGATADRAAGLAVPIFEQGVQKVPDGVVGSALSMDDKLTLAWSAPGNIFAQRGTLSFFVRPRTPVDGSPFTIFRVGAGDSTSWDMTFLRIDWNGQGFDAFVTDADLARTRVSWKMAGIPAADRWIHIAFAWDEAQGVTLWIDGKRVASKVARAVYDQALFGFGPFQRVISPQKVESGLNYIRSGDIDELNVYDHMLDDDQVAALAGGKQPEVPAAQPRSLSDANWRLRYGWDHVTGPADQAEGKTIAVRKVEFADARDQKEKAFRGADGIRETTWPGVYNRSRLPGRSDYFLLPDWNVYATAGQDYTLTLPDEEWNHIEIVGAAHGRLSASGETLFTRPQGAERTSTRLPALHRGGVLTFHNDVQETPIQEIGAYRISTIDAAPSGYARLDYKVDPAASPLGYASLSPLTGRIATRFPADERATVVALPAGAPVIRASVAKRDHTLPVVHVLVPATFRDQPPGGTPRRFSYGWENLNAGLDGVEIGLPPLDLTPGADGLAPLNIRLHDPLWPDRDLIDVIVRVKPGKAQRIWLDSRDRFLRSGDSVSLTLAADDPRFGAESLKGMTVSLVFKPAEAAKPEHVADRLEQARDNLASLIEEQPSTRLYPIWDRFERDVSDVLRVDPDNVRARALWVEKNPEQPAGPDTLSAAPAGVPEWAFRQTQALSQYRRFVDWWIDHRQIADGEFGGGLSDDTDLVNQWVGLALMGVEPDRLRQSQRALLDATYANGMWDKGLSFIQTDQLHSYEEGINALAQAMMLSWGDPREIERAMEVARNYSRLIEVNKAGHAHFVSAWFNGSRIDRGGHLGWQYPYSFLITHPGLLLVDYNGAPKVRSLVLSALDGWLAHGKQDAAGNWTYPQEIEWATDAARGTGVASAAHNFWAAWRWTGDQRFLRPLEPKGITSASLPTLFSVNADVLAGIPGGDTLARTIASDPNAVTDTANDPNLGSVSGKRLAQFIRWQETGDNAILTRLYEEDIRQTNRRMYVLTEAELWSDRVAVPSELLQRARMGGVAHLRNNYYPGNLVSWRFDDPDVAEKVGILIPKGDPKHFQVIAHNLSGRAVTATMTGAMLAPGLWRMTRGIDGDGDNRADAAGAPETVRLERGLGVELKLPPGQTIVYDFTLDQPGDDPATRADIGISADDLTLQGGSLRVRVHGLGAVATPAGRLTITDRQGRTLGEARFPALAAPADLLPKTQDVRVRLSGKPQGPLTVRVALDGAPAEVTQANNAAVLEVR